MFLFAGAKCGLLVVRTPQNHLEWFKRKPKQEPHHHWGHPILRQPDFDSVFCCAPKWWVFACFPFKTAKQGTPKKRRTAQIGKKQHFHTPGRDLPTCFGSPGDPPSGDSGGNLAIRSMSRRPLFGGVAWTNHLGPS